MDLQLRGKVALLVGGAGTIGRAIAQALSVDGAQVLIADQSRQFAATPERHQFAIDVTDDESVRQCFAAVVSAHGRIDILVMLAAVFDGTPIVEMTAAAWDRVLEINLKGTFLCCREALRHMQTSDYGRIICFSSLAAQVGGIVAGANYAASKAGVLSLVKSVAKQAGKPWITVNALCPGPVVGTMTDAWSAEMQQGMIAKIPAGRFAEATEVADLVAFLASPRAAYIHGAHLDINGGAYMD